VRSRHIIKRNGLAVLIQHSRTVAGVVTETILDTNNDPARLIRFVVKTRDGGEFNSNGCT
jgi:hypothetical protein